MIGGKKSPERKYLARPWELRGLIRCGCGPLMTTRTTKARSARLYHYYLCPRLGTSKRAKPCAQKLVRAVEVEAAVWGFVSEMLKDPAKVRAGMDALVDREKAAGSRDLSVEAEAWSRKLEESAPG